jgi:hypothetical protein
MMSGVHSSPILRSCGWSPIGGSRFSQGLWGGEFLGDSNHPSSSDFESTKSSFLACCALRLLSLESFLDHLQNYRVCWRDSRPSPGRVSDKRNIQKTKNKNKSNKTRVRQSRLDWFWRWSKLVDAKRKTKRKLKITQKAIKDRILITFSPATAPEKGACWRCIIVLDVK